MLLVADIYKHSLHIYATQFSHLATANPVGNTSKCSGKQITNFGLVCFLMKKTDCCHVVQAYSNVRTMSRAW